MTWREKLKKKVKESYNWIAKKAVMTTTFLSMFVGVGSSRPATASPTSDKMPTPTETVAHTLDSKWQSTLRFGSDEYRPLATVDMDKLKDSLSQMNIGQLIEKGILTSDDLQDYQFKPADFETMELGATAQKYAKRFAHVNGDCGGKCLHGVRTKTFWFASSDNTAAKAEIDGQAGFVAIGQYNLDGSGNISREAAENFSGGLRQIAGGKGRGSQPAGHIGWQDKHSDVSDGRMDKLWGLNKMGSRYGDTAAFYTTDDSRFTTEEFGKFIVQKALDKCENDASKLFAMVGISKEEIKDFSKPMGAFFTDYIANDKNSNSNVNGTTISSFAPSMDLASNSNTYDTRAHLDKARQMLERNKPVVAQKIEPPLDRTADSRVNNNIRSSVQRG